MSELAAAFVRRFGRQPTVRVQAPGRVNLIGEHTDYNGLPVLPMAIDRGIRILAAPRPDAVVELQSFDRRYPDRGYRLDAPIAPGPAGDWSNYHKAAVVELARELGLRAGGAAPRGADLLVAGDVPAAAGLASSSALVVASALAMLGLARVTLAPADLAERLARAERFVGTHSGGMDQAICLLARAGHASRLDFFPLRARPVALPADLSVVVCHSLVDAAKSGGARAAYNSRVEECAAACRQLSVRLDGPPIARLGDLVGRERDRPLESYAEFLPAGDRTTRRARHVLSEAGRVERAEQALVAGRLDELGDLLDASHRSLRDDYEVSHPELDALVDAARAAGALGARLTGAGFGGCTVNLVRRGDEGRFLAEIDRRFYAARLDSGRNPGEVRFVLAAAGGAAVSDG